MISKESSTDRALALLHSYPYAARLRHSSSPAIHTGSATDRRLGRSDTHTHTLTHAHAHARKHAADAAGLLLFPHFVYYTTVFPTSTLITEVHLVSCADRRAVLWP